MDVTVLGPQRRTTATRTAVAELIPTGTVATINAGWRERESADAELGEVLGGRMVNLRLYQRWQDLMAADPEYAAAERRPDRAVGGAAGGVRAAGVPRGGGPRTRSTVGTRCRPSGPRPWPTGSGLCATLDTWHLAEVAASRQQFYAATPIGERESVRAHRRELAELVDDSSGLVITGGHVGVLLHLLHVFGLVAMIKQPVITWSAGAMALSDRVVLFGDPPPGGTSVAGGVGRGSRRLLRGAALPAPPAPAAHARPVPARPAGAPVQGLDVSALRRRCPGRPDRRLATTGGRAVAHPGRRDLDPDRGPRDRGAGGHTVRRERSAGPATRSTPTW